MHAHNLFPKAINERLITVLILLPHNNFLSPILVYTSTLEYNEPLKDEFYRQQNELLRYSKEQADHSCRLQCPSREWHCHVESSGRKQEPWQLWWKRVHLLGICAEQKLLMKKYNLPAPTQQKIKWSHPGSKQWHTVDCSIISRETAHTSSSPLRSRCTDHRLLVSKHDGAHVSKT